MSRVVELVLALNGDNSGFSFLRCIFLLLSSFQHVNEVGIRCE